MSLKTYKINSNLAEYSDEEFSAIETLLAQEGIFDVTGTDQDFEVAESTPNAMTVDINTGSALIEYTKNSVTWKVVANNNTVETVSISANSSGSNRVDAIIVHLKQDEPNALKNNVAEFRVMLGTGIIALADNDIDTSLGDSNWYRLADITVSNGAVTITDSDIADVRARVTLDALPTAGGGNYVELTGNQNVAGVKTFGSFPITPSSDPTTDYQVANKKFVEDSIVLADPGISLINTGESIDGTTTPQATFISTGTADADATIVQAQVTENNTEKDVQGVDWSAQTFTMSAFEDTVTQIDLLLMEVGNPSGNFRLRIFAVDGSSKPTGASLAEQNVLATGIGTSSLVWVPFIFPSAIILSPATEYAIVVDVISGDGSNYVEWQTGNGNTYSGGQAWSSVDAGSTWSAHTDDLTFRVWSYEAQTAGTLYRSQKDQPFRGGFDGFVVSNTTIGNPATIRLGGIQDSFSGLTLGVDYYVDAVIGGITDSVGGLKVGKASSATDIDVDKADGYIIGAKATSSSVLSVSTLDASDAYAVFNVGFKPSKIDLFLQMSCQTGLASNVRSLHFNGVYRLNLNGTAVKLGNPTTSFTDSQNGMEVNSLSVIDGASIQTITANSFERDNGGFRFKVSVNAAGSGSFSAVAVCYR